ncbi:MAG: hypothetical protein ACLGH6_01650 [Gammaproteobacteria bacterium]
MNDRQAELDLAKVIGDRAEVLIAFCGRHAKDEEPHLIREVNAAISALIEYGMALAEGRVQLRSPDPQPVRQRFAVVDGGKNED